MSNFDFSKPVYNQRGDLVSIFNVEYKNPSTPNHTMVGIVHSEKGDHQMVWTPDGEALSADTGENLAPNNVSIRHEVWMNIYQMRNSDKYFPGSAFYDSQIDALQSREFCQVRHIIWVGLRAPSQLIVPLYYILISHNLSVVLVKNHY